MSALKQLNKYHKGNYELACLVTISVTDNYTFKQIKHGRQVLFVFFPLLLTILTTLPVLWTKGSYSFQG